MNTFTRLAVIAAFVVPSLAGAATTGGVGGLVSVVIIPMINNVLVPLIFALAFIVFLYGVAKAYIFSRGDEGAVEEGHKLILWGLVGFFVMLSIWGLVNVVTDTFGLSNLGNPNPPTFVPSTGS